MFDSAMTPSNHAFCRSGLCVRTTKGRSSVASARKAGNSESSMNQSAWSSKFLTPHDNSPGLLNNRISASGQAQRAECIRLPSTRTRLRSVSSVNGSSQAIGAFEILIQPVGRHEGATAKPMAGPKVPNKTRRVAEVVRWDR